MVQMLIALILNSAIVKYPRLCIMMFLQYALWGVWAVNLSVYLGGLESFRQDIGFKINMVFLTMAIANILAPFVASQLADRYFSTERYLAFSHLLGGGFLLWASQVVSFEWMFWVMLGHCLLYAPTVALTNSLSFHHLPNGEKEFGAVRLWGTIGWIVAGIAFGLGWLGMSWWAPGLVNLLPHKPAVGDCLVVAGVLSLIMAAFSLALPHTPPAKTVESPLAFLKAIELAGKPSFALMLVVAFLVSTELQFYYVLTPNFFHDEPGLSLSQKQLEKAASTKPLAPGEKGPSESELLMRLLDKNNNKKVSEAELNEWADRLTELNAALIGLKGTNGPNDAQAVEKGLKNYDTLLTGASTGGLLGSPLGQGPLVAAAELISGNTYLGRQADVVASYVVTAVDDTGSKKVDADQLEKFVKAVGPLTAKDGRIDKAREAFAADATEKGGLNLPEAWVGPVMTIGQFFEILMLAILPLALSRLGFTWTIAIGIGAWALRYAVFALGTPTWLVLASQGLHGFGFGFFFVGCMIYSDRIAPKDIRASAQGIIILVSFGFGMLVSSLVAGPIADHFENNWHYIFLAPVAVLVLCTLVFLIGFRPEPAMQEAAPGDKVGPGAGDLFRPSPSEGVQPPASQEVIPPTQEQKYL